MINYQGSTANVFAPGTTTPGGTLTGLSGTTALVLDPSGDLFIANSGNNTVSEFAGTTGPPVISTSAGDLNYTDFSGPQIVDPAVAVSDSESSTIVSATVTISPASTALRIRWALPTKTGFREVSAPRRAR